MNIRELIEQLEDLATELGDEAEVQVATQPSWPFANAITAVAATGVQGDDDEDSDEDSDSLLRDDDDEESRPTVYLATQQLSYLSGAAARALGWR